MNTDNLLQLLQRGLQVSVGATTSLVEILQDPQRRSKTLFEIQTQLTQKTQEWAQKGEMTEQEALRLVDEWLNRQQYRQSSTTTDGDKNYDLTLSSKKDRNTQEAIKKLTEQVIALRTELESLRQSNQGDK